MKELLEKLSAIIIEKTRNDDFIVTKRGPHTATAIYKEDESPDFELQIVWWIGNEGRWFASYDNSAVFVQIDDEKLREELYDIVCRKQVSENQ